MTGRQRFETAGLLLAVFVAGGLGGAALERRSHESDPWTGDGRELMSRPGGIPRFYETLGLSEEQRVEIHRILEAARPESDSILREALPRLREITVETRSAIADVLTDEQRARLEEGFRSRRDRHRGDSQGRGGRNRRQDHEGEDARPSGGPQ